MITHSFTNVEILNQKNEEILNQKNVEILKQKNVEIPTILGGVGPTKPGGGCGFGNSQVIQIKNSNALK